MMSVNDMKELLHAQSVTMTYLDGGLRQLYNVDGVLFAVDGRLSASEAAAEIKSRIDSGAATADIA
jgi:hypothetical protein